MSNKNKVTNLNEKLEEKLFDKHMNTMYDLADELIEREELTEIEESFLNAFMAWNDFLCKDEKDGNMDEGAED